MVSFTDHYNAIYIDRLPSKFKIGKDSWYFTNSLLCKPVFSSARKTSFLLKTQKTTTLQQVTRGNTPNLVSKRILRYFLISTTQENITISRQNLLFLLKIQKKKTSSASAWWGNTKSSFKENARTFPKSSTSQENIRTSKPKRDY